MTVLEMMADVAARIGDPEMTKLHPNVLLRWLRLASFNVQAAMMQKYPDPFIETATLTAASGSATLPSDFWHEIEVVIDSVPAAKVPPGAYGAVGVSSFYPATDGDSPLFYIDDDALKYWPVSATTVALRYVRRRDMDYDMGKCTSSSAGTVSTATGFIPSKTFVADYWIGGSIKLADVVYAITDNDVKGITFTGVKTATGLEAEVYLPSLVPEEYQDLLILDAVTKGLRYQGQYDAAAENEKRYQQALLEALGGAK